MKISQVLLFIFLLSCKSKSELIITESIKQNENLLKTSEDKIRDDFESAKIGKPIGMIHIIDEWFNRTQKIDSLYDKTYQVNNYKFPLDIASLNNSKDMESKVVSILYKGTENEILKKFIFKDVPIFFKNDSTFFQEIKSSDYNQETKKKLLINYLKFQKLQIKEYCFSICPKIRCGYNETFFLAIADKPIIEKGETITISAGVGEFKEFPTIYINNKRIDINIDNIAEIKFKTNEIGKFKIPVKIIDQNNDGTTTTYEKEVSYEVVNKTKE